MSHQKYQELIELFLYGELNKEEQTELERHLAFCRECTTEYESQKGFKAFLSHEEFIEADDQILNEARLQLRNTLRSERKFSLWEKIIRNIKEFTFHQYKIAFGGIALLLAGIALGYFIFKPAEFKIAPSFAEENKFSLLPQEVQITNVRFIDQDASDGEIEFLFEAVKPVRIKGSIDDEKIKNILIHSMINEENPGVRLNSINMIGRNEIGKADDEIKEAAITIVKYDKNPGVRREAFKLLNKFPYDKRIKETLLYILMNDPNSALRIEAINSLMKASEEGEAFNEDELSIFKEKMKDDVNYYIRFQAKNVVEEKRIK